MESPGQTKDRSIFTQRILGRVVGVNRRSLAVSPLILLRAATKLLNRQRRRRRLDRRGRWTS